MLREDNADLRLTDVGRKLGVVDDARWDHFNRKRDAIASEQERLRLTWVRPGTVDEARAVEVLGQPLEREYTLLDLLRRPNVGYDAAVSLIADPAPELPPEVREQVNIQAKYAGYIARQQGEVERRAEQEATLLPEDMDYADVRGLSFEARQKLAQHRPATIGQAGRISGMTPAAVALLLVHLKRRNQGTKLRQAS